MRRSWIRGLGVSLLLVLLLALAAELALRLWKDRERNLTLGMYRLHPSWAELVTSGLFRESADDVLRYELRPGASTRVQGFDFRINAHGLRGPELPPTKPPGERRLVVLGDSFAFGLWCREDETLAAHLARLASEREARLGSGLRWRGISVAVPGYTCRQQTTHFARLAGELAPDAVVVYFNTNDILAEGFFLDAELGFLRRDAAPLPVGLRRLLWGSHLYGWLLRRTSDLQDPGSRFAPTGRWSFTDPENRAVTREALADVQARCAELGVPLFLLHQPLWTWSGAAREPDWEALPALRWVEDVTAQLGVPEFGLLGFLRGYADGVDRSQDTPPDFLVDRCLADERVLAAFAAAEATARAQGHAWKELPLPERTALVLAQIEAVPELPDTHLTGDCYARIAELAYPHMQRAGVLP